MSLLLHFFKSNPTPDSSTILYLAEITGLSPNEINEWFQTTRAKFAAHKAKQAQSSPQNQKQPMPTSARLILQGFFQSNQKPTPEQAEHWAATVGLPIQTVTNWVKNTQSQLVAYMRKKSRGELPPTTVENTSPAPTPKQDLNYWLELVNGEETGTESDSSSDDE